MSDRSADSSAERSADTIHAIPTPALVVESAVLDSNLAAVDSLLPGDCLRPHVKAFKSTALARRLSDDGHHGFCCANSGVDQSSSGGEGRILTLPVDPDGTSRAHRARFAELGVDVAVIMTDTFGRPWREGQTDIAIGIAGMNPLYSYIGQEDPHGHEFRVQEICTADELAAAGELVKGNTSRVPVAVVRGVEWERDDEASMAPVLRDSERDLFR